MCVWLEETEKWVMLMIGCLCLGCEVCLACFEEEVWCLCMFGGSFIDKVVYGE